MKFQCEICGAAFASEGECTNHERECKFKHIAALSITDELNALIGSAAVQKLALCVEVITGDKDKPTTEFFALRAANFNAAKNKITIHLIPNEKEASNPDKGTKKKS